MAEKQASIVVLPFVNMSSDAEQEYFCDGVGEEIINCLTRVQKLRVVARTSAFSFKGQNTDVREIGRKLGAAAVLEGSVRKMGNRVRIGANLVDVASGYDFWADTFERELTDIFAIQSEVALRIVAALETELSPDEEARLADHAGTAHAPDPAAYEAYLRGRFHWYQHTPESLATALRYFELAVQKDTDYALAHGAIADTWGARTNLGLVAPSDAYPHVQSGVLKAIELDDGVPETHDLLARLRFWYEWNWHDAERAFEQAIQLGGNYPDARMMYSLFLASMKHWDEAAYQIRRALELDPLNALFHWGLGLQLLFQRQYGEAIDQFRRMLQLEPSALLARLGLWTCFHQENAREEARAHAMRYFEALADQEVLGALDCGFAEGGYRRSMQRAAEVLAKRFTKAYVPPTQVARLFAFAEDPARALQWLERAYAARDFEMVFLNVHPTWDPLRPDPRFQDLLRLIKFPE